MSNVMPDRNLVRGSDFIRTRQELVESVEALRSGDEGSSTVFGARCHCEVPLGMADFDADFMS